jgi:hypothetical protein
MIHKCMHRPNNTSVSYLFALFALFACVVVVPVDGVNAIQNETDCKAAARRTVNRTIVLLVYCIHR